LTAAGGATPDEDRTPQVVTAGRVGKPHGLDGSFYVTMPKPRLLELGAAIALGARPTTIVRRAGTDARPIVRVQGVEDREAAQELRGQELTVALAQAPTLAEGEWWAHELEGCTVGDGERVLGQVSRLLALPSCEALEVLPAGGGEPVLVPLVKDAVRSVRPRERRIEVDLDFLGVELAPAAGAGAHAPSGRDRDEPQPGLPPAQVRDAGRETT